TINYRHQSAELRQPLFAKSQILIERSFRKETLWIIRPNKHFKNRQTRKPGPASASFLDQTPRMTTSWKPREYRSIAISVYGGARICPGNPGSAWGGAAPSSTSPAPTEPRVVMSSKFPEPAP